MVSLGIVNSRYKDLFDLYSLLVDGGLEDDVVVGATRNTFLRRQTSVPENPESLSSSHWQSNQFNVEWNRFLERIGADSPNFSDLQEGLLPRMRGIYNRTRSSMLEQ